MDDSALNHLAAQTFQDEAADRLHYPGEGGSGKVIAQGAGEVFEDAYKAAYPDSAAVG